MKTIASVIFILIALGVAAFILIKLKNKRDAEARMKWVVPLGLLDSLLPKIEIWMDANGFAKGDYVLNIKDCTEYSSEWKWQIAHALKRHRPKDQTEWIKLYSFHRDPREDGADPGRHRVVGIKTTDGMKFIDTYRINGSLYRPLSDTEQKNGHFV